MASTYTPIATYTLGSNQTTVTFNSINGSYTDLILITNIKDTNGYNLLRVNNDSTTIYSRTYVSGNGTAASSSRSTGLSEWYVTSNSADYASSITQFMNYSNTSTYKTALSRYGYASAATTAAVYLWRSTSAISRIDIISATGTATMETGSTFTLYGIAAA